MMRDPLADLPPLDMTHPTVQRAMQAAMQVVEADYPRRLFTPLMVIVPIRDDLLARAPHNPAIDRAIRDMLHQMVDGLEWPKP